MQLSPGMVVGFHGCSRAVFEEVVQRGGNLKPSSNDYDWLGHGIYFWEGSPDRARRWAEQHHGHKDAAVIGAFIKLGNCVDLLDSFYLDKVKDAYELLKLEREALGEPLPENRGFDGDISFIRELDCRVMLRLQAANNDAIAQELGLPDMSGNNKRKIQNHPECFDTVRGMFPEGRRCIQGRGSTRRITSRYV